jgi:sugar lactone lactonase YvrE
MLAVSIAARLAHQARRARWLMAGPGLAALALFALCFAAPASAAVPSPSVVVSNPALSSTLTSYSLASTGNAAPSVPALSSADLRLPQEMALDGAGDVWVASRTANTVTEYSPSELATGGSQAAVLTLRDDGNGGLDGPEAVAFDAEGDLWVANGVGNTLSEYTPGQLAQSGNPPPAVQIKNGASASLNLPVAMAFDSDGDLWVANNNANTLVEYTPQELTQSGGPAPALTIGTDQAGSLNAPDSLAFDALGDLWVSNGRPGNSVVEYLPVELTTTYTNPTPYVTLTSSSGSLTGASQIGFDAGGDLWVVDSSGGPSGTGALVKFSPSQLAQSGSPTPDDTIAGTDTQLNDATGLVIEQAPTVSEISTDGGPAGSTTVITGTGFLPGSAVRYGSLPAASVTYVSPYKLIATAPAGAGTADITVTTAEGTSAASAADRFTYDPRRQSTPIVTTSDSVAGWLQSYALAPTGPGLASATPIGTLLPPAGSQPGGLAVDRAGDVWVVDPSHHALFEYTPTQLAVGGRPAPAVTLSSAAFNAPAALAFDSAGDLWVADAVNDTLVSFSKEQLAAGGVISPSVTLSSAALTDPSALAFDAAGNLWVANTLPAAYRDQDSIVEFTGAQLIVTSSQSPAVTLLTDSAGSLNQADGLAFDAAGDLWVENRNEIPEQATGLLEYTPQQLVSGTPVPHLTISGTGGAQIAFDTSGNLWAADQLDQSGQQGALLEFSTQELQGAQAPDTRVTGQPFTGVVVQQPPAVSSVSPSAGTPGAGTQVTITGAGFYPGSMVDFGAIPATSVTYVTPYELIATAPAGTGTVDVTASNALGTSAVSPADQFSYSASAAASPAAAAPAATPAVTQVPPTIVAARTAGTLAPRPRVSSTTRRVTFLRKAGSAAVTIMCANAACRGTVKLTQLVLTKHRGGKTTRKAIVLGTATYKLTAGHHTTVHLHLDPVARAALAKAKRHTLTVTLTITAAPGVTLSRSVALVQVP